MTMLTDGTFAARQNGRDFGESDVAFYPKLLLQCICPNPALTCRLVRCNKSVAFWRSADSFFSRRDLPDLTPLRHGSRFREGLAPSRCVTPPAAPPPAKTFFTSVHRSY